jgi:RHS repeat-associated protein
MKKRGADVDGYRYTAFGQTKEDTATLAQPLRWQARWHSTLNGVEVYDVRARQWAPEIGTFLSIDDYGYFSPSTTLWGWPGMSPEKYRDPTGRGPIAEIICALLVPSPWKVQLCFTGPPVIPTNDNERKLNETLEEYCVLIGERAREACEARLGCPTEAGLLQCIGEGVEAYDECKRRNLQRVK